VTSPSPPPLLTCPACQRVTPLPPQIGLQAVVRCPHCRAQFALQDLLVEPAFAWELVSDDEPRVGARRSDRDELAADYTYVDPSEELAVSPGAKTVEIPDYQSMLDSWKDPDPEEELFEPVADVLFDSNRAHSGLETRQTLDEYADERIDLDADEQDGEPVDEPPRRLEGPLVGEFPDDLPSSPAALESLQQEGSESTASPAQFAPHLVDKYAGDRLNYASHLGQSASRRKRPRRSPIWSILQVALGGLAAIPISLLLMWHLLGTDIGDAAPWVAQYAPWAVPEKFHPYAPFSATATPARRPTSGREPVGPLPTPAIADDEIPTVQPRALSNPELETAFESTSDEAVADVLLSDFGSSRLIAPDTETDTDTTPSPPNDSAESVPDDTVQPLLQNSPTPPDTTRQDSAIADALPKVEAAELAPADWEPLAVEKCFALILQTEERLGEWPQAVETRQSNLKSLAQTTYGELASLAMAIDNLPPSHALLRAVRGKLKPIGRQVQLNPEVRQLIEQGARFYVQKQSTEEPPMGKTESNEAAAPAVLAASEAAEQVYGLAMTIVVDSVTESSDGEWSMVVPTTRTQVGTPPLELRIPRDVTISLPTEALANGQSLFLLGTVRPHSEETDSGITAAPDVRPFVASYVNPF
jgi:hypothetical protein